MKIGFLREKPAVLIEAGKAKFKPNIFVQILIFVGLFFGTNLIMGIFLVAIDIFRGNFDFDLAGVPDSAVNCVLAVSIALYILYVKYGEGRSLKSMGFTRGGALRQYGTGFLAGTVMIVLSLGICLVTGAMEFRGVVMTASVWVILLWLLSFLIQGMSEEVIMRGYFLVSASNRIPVMWAVVISSVMFAALHLMNSNITVLAFVNLILYGAFAAFYFLRTNSIWGIAAQHSAWNFIQGNVLGIEVSGQQVNDTVMSFASTGKADTISGGLFGLEGGLAVTLVFTAGIVLLLFLPRKDKKKIPNS